MSTLVNVDDPRAIERFLRRETALHLYELGDLDPFFWPHTRWFGWLQAGGELSALALLYTGSTPPTLLALDGRDVGSLGRLLEAVAPHLPPQFDAHLSPGLLPCLGSRRGATHRGLHLKMVHRDRRALLEPEVDEVESLRSDAAAELSRLYEQAYPGNWFDPRTLDTGQYFGIRRNGVLVSAAGTHVRSAQYRVAVVGNVTTAPGWRNQGLARRVTARLCESLYASADCIGLNVEADNLGAVACYRRLGFVEAAHYDEYSFDAGGP
jgi:ribosomal protein S18 acetylase RimI-like enzyme